MRYTATLGIILTLLLYGCVIVTTYDGSKRYIHQEGSGQYVDDFDENESRVYFFSFPFNVYNPTNSTIILKFKEIGIEYSSRKSWFDKNKRVKIWEKPHKSLDGGTINCLRSDNKEFFDFFKLEPGKMKYFWLCSRDRPNPDENHVWYYIEYFSCNYISEDISGIDEKNCAPEYYSFNLNK